MLLLVMVFNTAAVSKLENKYTIYNGPSSMIPPNHATFQICAIIL